MVTQTIALSQPGHTAVVRAIGTGHFLITRDLWLPVFWQLGCHRQLFTLPLGAAGTPGRRCPAPGAPSSLPRREPSCSPRAGSGIPAAMPRAPAGHCPQPAPPPRRKQRKRLPSLLPSFLPLPCAGRAAPEPPPASLGAEAERQRPPAASSRGGAGRRRDPRPVPVPRRAALTTTCAPGSFRDLGLISGDTM